MIGQLYYHTSGAVCLFCAEKERPEYDTILIPLALICFVALMGVTGTLPVTGSPVTRTSHVPSPLPVPCEIRKRPTGIVGLNILLDGGFPEGTLIMVHGTAVAGVELAARHFCNDHPDESGTYVVPEEIIEGEGTNAKMNPALLLEHMRGTRVVMDSLSDVIERYGIEQALFILTRIKEDIRKNNANLMFIVYSNVHTPMDMTRIMRAADIVIEFKTQISQSEINRTLSVQKIKGGAVPQRLLSFIITDHGIEASTTSRVV
ncbi:MAG: ATPase domain-containing protein [Methanoregula sp.]|nr:ATPase domain-containing protein [Methanoregula sp.]